jgi:anti-anti-sigma regulatory factor
MTLTINNEQDLRTVGALQQQLLEAIAPGQCTMLDIAGVTAADLGFVQVIESARRHAAAVGGELCLAGPAPAPVRDVLDLAGFSATPAKVFWTHGANQP